MELGHEETSVRTIHKHTQSIYAKLGVETRTAAARTAIEAGLGGTRGESAR